MKLLLVHLGTGIPDDVDVFGEETIVVEIVEGREGLPTGERERAERASE